MIDMIKKIVAPLQRRITMMVLRAVVQNVDTSKPMTQFQFSGFPDEILTGIEYIEPYGFTSAPEEGAEAVVLFIAGNRDHGVAISVGDRATRLKGLLPGEAALYHKDGTKILMKGGGKIQITNPAGNELVAVLSETLQFLINARTDTMLGPQPLFDITGMDTLADIKTKLDTFKV